MRLIKLISALCLAVILCACQAGTDGADGNGGGERAPSCVLEAEEYTLRVVRGEKRLEFTSPELLCGVSVVFDSEGKCVLQTPGGTNTDGTDAGANSDTAAGVSIPLEDARGWLDWLVVAYPEDYLPEDQLAEGTPDTFSLNGADFSVTEGSKCTITRANVSRSAIRSDE